MRTPPAPSAAQRLRASLSSWAVSGAKRSWRGIYQLLLAAGSASLAYLVAHHLWGHQYPFFASITAFIVIGFTADTKIKKVLELAAGVLLGVLLGELARTLIGSGVWQIFVTIFIAVSASRFLNNGIMFSMQAGIQSLLVMLMPASPTMNPTGRVIDAITGVSIAIIIFLLFSADPRRAQTRAARDFFLELEDTLSSLALAARTGSRDVAMAALREIRRKSQQHTDAWTLANETADEIATYSPTRHHHAEHVKRVQRLLVGSDRAMRNVRVIARRQSELMTVAPGISYPRLADSYVAAVDAIQQIRLAVAEDADFTAARRQLRIFCSYLSPEDLLTTGAGTELGRMAHFEGITLVIQVRSLAIDLLEATGLAQSDARRFLPSLLIAADDTMIGPKPITQELKAVEPPATTALLEAIITSDEAHPLTTELPQLPAMPTTPDAASTPTEPGAEPERDTEPTAAQDPERLSDADEPGADRSASDPPRQTRGE